jgi:LysR family nitrogen assimilation transcriptional regulator
MELTDAGRILVEYARRALRELEQARAEIQPAHGAVSGLVNVGLLPSTCDLIAGELVAGLKREHPQIQLRLTTGYAGHLQQWLEQGEVDVAMLYNLKPSPVLEVEPLMDERLYLVGLPTSGLRMNKPQPLSSLKGRQLILPSAPHGIRSVVEHACAAADIPLEIAAEANAMSLQKLLVLHGLGFTILPSAAIFDDLERGSLAAAPIVRPDLRRRIVLALPASRRTSAAVRCVVEALTQQVRACVKAGRWPGARLL